MLGFSKIFVIFLFISIVIGYGTGNWMNGVSIIIGFAIIAVIWKILT